MKRLGDTGLDYRLTLGNVNSLLSSELSLLLGDLDVPLGIELGAPAGTIASVQLYVNGYQCKYPLRFYCILLMANLLLTSQMANSSPRSGLKHDSPSHQV